MRPAACRILACPHCQTWLRCQSIELNQRLGVTVWSDLRVDHSFWQCPAQLAQCRGCGKAFRKNQAKIVGTLPSSHESLAASRACSGWSLIRWGTSEKQLIAKFEAAPVAAPLSEADAEAALAYAAGDEDETDLRLQLWRHHNDRRRGMADAGFREVESRWRDNQDRLLGLLRDDDELHQLLAAEIHRQRAEFHQAMGNLSRVRQQYGREKAALMGWIVEGRSELQVFY
jgi:hypothetical protein